MNDNNRSQMRENLGGEGSIGEANSEETLRSERIQIERKHFVFTLKENPRGRFLRITEDVGGRRDTIIIPATGLGEFARIIAEMNKGPTGNAEPSEPEDRRP